MAAPPTPVTALPTLPARPRDGHKGTFGRVLVVAGSRGMAGAAVLAGTAALRGGAGLVRVATPDAVLDTVATGFPCYTTAPLPCDPNGRITHLALGPILDLADDADVVAVGPGLGRTAGLMERLIACVSAPLVLDADALNSLAPLGTVLKSRSAPTVLTPHPGEFARLADVTIAEVQANREAWAVRFPAECGGVLLLKGAGTLVSDGTRLYRNTTGNPGMATGGTGDVLTGLVAALLARLGPFDAACLAAHLHGLAGDRAAAALGEDGLTALDLLNHLPDAFRSLPRSADGRKEG